MKIFNLVICVFLISFVNMTLHAQAGDKMFDNSILHEVRIEFSNSDYWNQLIDNYESTPEGSKIPYLLGKVNIDGMEVDSVGIRLKGFTSYGSSEVKKPIKIDFNEFVKGQKYDGLRKLNLNNGTGDPGMQRDVICYDMLRSLGVKASRTSFSKVYLNDTYWGLYQNIEQVDKAFLKNNFVNNKGNLYKNKGWDTLQWRGNMASNYYPPYELKTNKKENNWEGFVNFVDVINNTSDADFKTEIEKVFDVDVFLKTLAVDVATNNWDSYLEHGRNWYIYEDPKTGIFSWIPWDYNLSLSANLGFGGDDECFLFADFGYEPLDSVSIEFKNNTFYVQSGVSYSWDFGDGNFSTEKNPSHIYSASGKYNVCLTATLSDTCYNELCKSVDTKFDIEACPSILDGSCPHPPNDIFKQVVDFSSMCCDTWNEECENIYQWLDDPNGGGGDGFSNRFTIDQSENEKILIKRLLNVPQFNTKYYQYFCELMDNYMTENHLFKIMNDNGQLIKNAVAEDPNYLFTYEQFQKDIGLFGDTSGLRHIISTRIVELVDELSSSVDCATVNVKNLNQNLNFSVSPNPTKNILQVYLNTISNQTYQLNVFSSTGSLIYSENDFQNTDKQLDVSSWNNGLYIIALVDQEGRIGRQKFVVSH